MAGVLASITGVGFATDPVRKRLLLAELCP